MRRRRHAHNSRKTYTLEYLLSRQPKTLSKHRHYGLLISHLYASQRLLNLRVSRRCFSVLHDAQIKPENLQYFYLTYGLPKEPFFPLFFQIKRDYLRERERKREERRQYILNEMRRLPAPTLAFIKYLGYLEAYYHSRGRSPLWQRYIFPTTKKQVRGYAAKGTPEWLGLFREHLDRLGKQYPGLGKRYSDRLLACFVLDCIPPEIPPAWPRPAEVTARYRRLSLLHHPDRGGDSDIFLELKRAKDILTG
jgi:hypothetical protein